MGEVVASKQRIWQSRVSSRAPEKVACPGLTCRESSPPVLKLRCSRMGKCEYAGGDQTENDIIVTKGEIMVAYRTRPSGNLSFSRDQGLETKPMKVQFIYCTFLQTERG